MKPSKDTVAALSSLRISTHPARGAAELDELRIEGKHATEMLSSPGWKFLQNWLAVQHATAIRVLTAKPTEDTADEYALKRADAAGFLRGLQHAFEVPHALVQIAEEELTWAQRASEELAQRQGEHHG